MMRRTNYLVSMCLASLLDLTLSIVLMAFRVFSVRFLSYLSGLLRFLSNSKVESCKILKQEQEKTDKHPILSGPSNGGHATRSTLS